jgi:hypothetical protein
MSFTTAPIIEIRHNIDGGELVVSWTSTAPVGSWYQLYVDGELQGVATQETFLHIPMPETRVTLVVGVVDAANVATDYSASIPAVPKMTASLEWLGGRYLAEDISSYRVFMGLGPGQSVSFAKVAAEIPAFSASQYLDGFGRGGFGRGGFGRAAQSYEWTSGNLAAGPWSFAIQSVDIHGNPCDVPTTGSVTIAGPPEPTPRDARGRRVWVDGITITATANVRLAWLASPTYVAPETLPPPPSYAGLDLMGMI